MDTLQDRPFHVQQPSNMTIELVDDPKEKKIIFNNEKKDEIMLTELNHGFSREIVYPHLFHNLKVTVVKESIYILIIEQAPGVACECCSGSGRKRGT